MRVRVLLKHSHRLDNQRISRWAEYLFLFIGLIAVDYYIWISLDTTFYQAYESWSFDRQAQGLPVSFSKFLKAELGLESTEDAASGAGDHPSVPKESASAETLPSDNSGGVRDRQAPDRRAQQTIIGRILVPRLKLSAMVREGVEDDTLQRAVGHIPSTALPGQEGNVALAGHRDTFFRKLRDIRKTDKIVLATLKGNYDYVVESTKVVTPSDVSVLDVIPGEQVLTLVTCFPFNFVGAAPQRFIVRAKQIESSSQPRQSGS